MCLVGQLLKVWKPPQPHHGLTSFVVIRAADSSTHASCCAGCIILANPATVDPNPSVALLQQWPSGEGLDLAEDDFMIDGIEKAIPAQIVITDRPCIETPEHRA